MATLGSEDRTKIHRGLMRYWSRLREALDCSKALLLTLVGETDTWINDNQGAYVASLSANSLTAAQLALLFACVALMRVGLVGLLRRALGVGVD